MRPVTGPTILTIARMILAVVFAIFAMLPGRAANITSLVLFLIAAITDKIDGIWARRTHQVTDVGAFLDPLADKMLTSLAFLILVYENIVPLWVFAVILVRDLAVDGMRMSTAKSGITIAASPLGKLKTTFQMLALVLFLLNQAVTSATLTVIANVILYIALALTVISGFDYLIKGFAKAKK